MIHTDNFIDEVKQTQQASQNRLHIFLLMTKKSLYCNVITH